MTARHDLVWLTQAGWDAAIARVPVEQHAALLQWRDHDRPAVVRRRDDGCGADDICLGIPLPPGAGTHPRLALVARTADVARTSSAVTLADALAAAPPQWLAALVALQRAAVAFDLRVYGSLAMASITGLAYLRPASDIDLLLRPRSRAELDAGVALLTEHAGLLPLDGEILFPDGAAVAWKEWAAAPADRSRVLVKSLQSVRLADPATLTAALNA